MRATVIPDCNIITVASMADWTEGNCETAATICNNRYLIL